MNQLETQTYDPNTILIPKTVQHVLDYGATKAHSRPPVYMKYFWKVLLIISVFYGLPSIQFVVFQYQEDVRDKCYFNFKCAHSAFGVFAFNNVVSNLGYILCGLGYLLFVRVTSPYEDSIHGLHTDMSLFYSMGFSVVLEGLFSSLYHVCPSKMNFQFDATFMLIGSGLLFITIYQKRHPAFSTGVFKAYSFFAIFVFLNFLSLTNIPASVFWTAVSLCFAYISWQGSAHIYQQQRVGFSPRAIADFAHMLVHPGNVGDKIRFYCLVLANLLSWIIIIGSAVVGMISSDSRSFSSVILGVIVLNFQMYLIYYLAMKRRFHEHIRWFVWVLFLGMFVLWIVAMYFFEIAVTNKFETYEQSMALNKPCVLFHYFDDHDVWHFLSALALIDTMLLVYLLDTDLNDVPRTEIAVF